MWFGLSCPVCGASGRAPCRRCESTLGRAPALALPPGVDALSAICEYHDAGRALVHALKFRNCRATARWAADRMSASLAVAPSDLAATDWGLTWAPTASARRRERGFDQAERLARLVGRRVGLRAQPLLVRAPGMHQTGRSAEERWLGPRFRATRRPMPPCVIVVDDVVTTGATASAAARALRAGGAQHIWFLALARTTFKPRGTPAEVAFDASRQPPGEREPGAARSR